MKLIKTTFFSGIIAVIRIASGFVASKIIAVFTGPAGVAVIGAFSNFITIALTFANGAINTGVVKYTAEYAGDDDHLKTLFSTALRITVYCSTLFGVVLLLFAPLISNWIFTSGEFVNPIRVLGLTMIFYALNSLLISILNGRGEIRTYTIVNTTGSIISLLLTLVLVYLYKTSGALYALVLGQSITFFVTAFLLYKSPWFSMDFFRRSLDKITAIKLGSYSLMALVTALTVPISQIILRNMLNKTLGIDAAGYWQGMMRISDGYLMLITTSLSTYYLPKLSSIKNDSELRSEILQGYKIILPAVFVSCAIVFFLRHWIVTVLYTGEFAPMEQLFFWQLLGDFFKLSAWVLAYLMLAKSMTRIYIVTEILFSASYLLLGYLFVKYFALEGISMAFALNYLFYLLLMIFVFKNLLFKSKPSI